MNPGYTVVQTAELVSALRWVTGQLFEITGAWAQETAQAASNTAAAGAQTASGDTVSNIAAAAGDQGGDDGIGTASDRSAGGDALSNVVAASADRSVDGDIVPSGDQSVGGGIAAGGNQSAYGVAGAEAAVWMATLSRRLGCHREMLDGLQPDSDLLAAYRLPVPPDPSVDATFAEIAAAGHQWTEQLTLMLRVLLPQLLAAYDEIAQTGAQHCDGALIRTTRALHHDLQPHRDKGEQLLTSLLISPNGHTGSEPATSADHVGKNEPTTSANHDAESESVTLVNRVSDKLNALGEIVPRRLLCPTDSLPT